MSGGGPRWRLGDRFRTECDDVEGRRAVVDLTAERVQGMNCPCVRLVTTRPGSPAGTGDMHVYDAGACRWHRDGEDCGPVERVGVAAAARDEEAAP